MRDSTYRPTSPSWVLTSRVSWHWRASGRFQPRGLPLSLGRWVLRTSAASVAASPGAGDGCCRRSACRSGSPADARKRPWGAAFAPRCCGKPRCRAEGVLGRLDFAPVPLDLTQESCVRRRRGCQAEFAGWRHGVAWPVLARTLPPIGRWQVIHCPNQRGTDGICGLLSPSTARRKPACVQGFRAD